VLTLAQDFDIHMTTLATVVAPATVVASSGDGGCSGDNGSSGDNGNPNNGVVAPVMAFILVRLVTPAAVVVVMMAETSVVVMTAAAVVCGYGRDGCGDKKQGYNGKYCRKYTEYHPLFFFWLVSELLNFCRLLMQISLSLMFFSF